MSSEVFAATVGGVQLREPAADLAIALALAGGCLDRPLPADLVAFGELGLAGEVRTVTGIERRLTEAHRLGFTQALVPAFTGRVPEGMNVSQVSDVHGALRALLQVVPPAPR
jgi:DNA repair protein RadA/Sms